LEGNFEECKMRKGERRKQEKRPVTDLVSKQTHRDSLVVQCLRIHVSKAEAMGSILGRGIKILCAT
jgi:hypothetical protein